MTHQLEVHALSPLRPAPDELLAQAALPGLPLDLRARPCAGAGSTDWQELELFLGGGPEDDVVARLRCLSESDRSQRHARWRQEREAGQELPDYLFEGEAGYVLELEDGTGGEGEDDRQAVFVLAAWSLASLTEGLVVDEEAGIIADAESFWELLTEGLDGMALEAEMDEGHDERPSNEASSTGEHSRPSGRGGAVGRRRKKSTRDKQRAVQSARHEGKR